MSKRELEPIAIVGLGGILPEAPDLAAFWSNVELGRDCIAEVPADRWDWRLYYDSDPKAKDKTYSKIGGFVRDFRFDPLPFRIPPPVAEQMDGVQRLAISATAQALADYGKKDLDPERTAVIIGNSMGGSKKEATDLRVHSAKVQELLKKTKGFAALSTEIRAAIFEDFNRLLDSELPRINEDSMPGELSNVIAGRIANTFNWNGPNFTVDAACASSLAALDAAVKGLRLRDFDVAVCGAVDQMMGPAPYVKFSKIGALSPDGSRPFDDRANGFVMGEGSVVYVLKRLSDAVRSGDRIYALVRAIGSSSDGRGKGITAPNPKGQRLAIERAFEQVEYGPEAVTLVEAHGTSTPVGDATEASVLGEMFAGLPAGSVGLGSVKSQIGHLKAAAGAAALAKTALALHKKVLPPSINFRVPNRSVDWSKNPFRVVTETQPWPNGRTRRANVSAFGFGGTNFHVALEEYIESARLADPRLIEKAATGAESDASARTPSSLAGPEGKPPKAVQTEPKTETRPTLSQLAQEVPSEAGGEAFVMTAESPDALRKALDGLQSAEPMLLEAQPLRTSPRRPYLASFAARTAAEAREKAQLLSKALAGDTVWTKPPAAFRAKGLRLAKSPSKPKVAFLFPGQGSQYVDMMRDLSLKYRVVAETFAEADRIMTPLLGEPLTAILFSKPGESEVEKAKREERIKRTEITQPAVLTGDIAMLKLLRSFGLEPDVVAGHSLGEYGALVAAGVLTFESALLAVSARAKEMAGVEVPDPGKMASVSASWEKASAALKGIEGYVEGANRNCPIQTVIAGETKAVETAIERFQALGIQASEIRVSHAFHSRIVAPAQEPYRRFLKTVEVRKPSVPILSNVTAELYPDDPEAIRELLVRQIASPVQFIGEIERMYADGVRVFVEVGPKRVLTAFVSSILESKPDALALASNHPKRGGLHELNDLLAGLEAAGARLDWSGKEPGGKAYTPAFVEWLARKTLQDISLAPPDVGRGEGGVSGQEASEVFSRFGFNPEPIVVSGTAAGVPGSWDALFREGGLDEILRGQNLIEKLPESELRRQLDKNITRVLKSDTGHHEIRALKSTDEVIKLAARKGEFDLAKEFGVPENVAKALDVTFGLAIGAGLLALKDARIPLVRRYKKATTGAMLPQGWGLPEPMRDTTGIIFASAFPGFDAIVDELTRYFEAKAGRGSYSYSRDFLLKVLALGHSQLAQWIGARGPAAHVNTACASTTQAVGMAEDWIRLGRAKRVVVIAGDDLTNERLQEWFVTGFLAAGAATTESAVSRAALPFDRRRHGMIVGMAAVGLVVEEAREAEARGVRPWAEVIATEFANSAFHPTRLDPPHVAEVMERLLRKAERRLGTKRSQLAAKTLFMSHETYTPARGGSASAEVEALKRCFGADASKVVVSNTKGFTGHTMGASLEDVVAIRAMATGLVPPIANYKEPDPELAGILLSDGSKRDVEYALRLGAGFGSQTAMTFLRRLCRVSDARFDDGRFRTWLRGATGIESPELEVVCSTLRVRDDGPAEARVPASGESETGRQASAPAAAAAPANSSTAMSEPKVRSEILALVREKTGYPDEMLDLDLDMEADLGIDTVKQAELFGLVREKYEIPRKEGLSLKQYPTLRHVIRFVLDNDGVPVSATAALAAPPERAPVGTLSAAAAKPSPKPVAVAAKAPAAPAASARDEKALQEEILKLVAEKTGYPTEMLDLDLDMEADLGIDTVKQAELFGLVREKYEIPRKEGLSLKQYPTLRHVVRFVLEGASGTVPPPASPAEPEKVPAGTFSTAAPLRRRIVEAVETPLPAGTRDLPEGCVLIVGAPKTLKAFQPRWGERKVALISTKPFQAQPAVDLADPKALDAALEAARKAGPVAALVYLAGLDLASDEAPEAFDAQYRGAVRPLFLIAKALREDLSRPGAAVAVATAMGGRHEASASTPALMGALTGLAKALSKELGNRVCALDFEPKAGADELAEKTAAELVSAAEEGEVGYAAGRRWTLRLVEGPAGRQSFAPTRESVVLVTGGGRGLAAEFAKTAAAKYGCKLAILGRTPLREEAKSWAELDEAGLNALKDSMCRKIRASLGKKATPVLLEREFAKVRRAVELWRNLAAMRERAETEYFECDLARRDGARSAVEKALARFGRVDAVVHAAGLEESKALADKTVESFDAVFGAKALGLKNVLDALGPSKGRRHLFFSSVVARFGNLGQTDYAAANDYLVKSAARLTAQGEPAVAVDLTAFDEIGMAMKGGVRLFLESMGVELVKPAQGVEAMLAELEAPGATEVVLSAGLGQMEQAPAVPSPARRMAGEGQGEGTVQAGSNGFRRLLTGFAASGADKWGASRQFSLDSDPYLLDHRIAGVPYVPGVMGLELFAQLMAEIGLPEAKASPRGLVDVRFALPMKLLRNRPLPARAAAIRADGALSLSIESDFVTPQGVRLGGPRTHFTAKAEALPASRFEGAAPGAAGTTQVSREAIYQAYFHGESFQVLDGILSVDASKVVSKIRPTKGLWPDGGGLLIAPLVIEAAFQTCGYRDLHFAKRTTLPDSIGAVLVWPERCAGELTVTAVYKGADASGRSVYDAFVTDAEGRLAAELQDYKMIGVEAAA